MTKFVLSAVLFTLLAASFAMPATTNTGTFTFDVSGIGDAAASGNWDLVHKLLQQRLNNMYHLQPASPAHRDLFQDQQLGPGKSYSESEFKYQSSKNVGGTISEQKGGVRSVNDNGKVSTYKL